MLIHLELIPQNGQTHPNNSLDVYDHTYGIKSQRLNSLGIIIDQKMYIFTSNIMTHKMKCKKL